MRRESLEGANDPTDVADSRQILKGLDELRAAPPRIFRPTISVGAEPTQVRTEHTAAVAPERLGDLVGHVASMKCNESTLPCAWPLLSTEHSRS